MTATVVMITGFQLQGGEVYHYHTKLMMKEAFTGGRFIWHQDYGSVHKSLFFSSSSPPPPPPPPPVGIHMLSTTTLCACVSGRGDKGVLVSCSHGSFNKDGVKSDLFMNSCHDSRNLTGQITEAVKLYIYI